ncbi:hypothetical protein MKW94_019561 [Papaver nudicaule]|uniref:Transmembrane protein 33 homolog n=1 Tax=Papaver nudicaule TaxID=74823 RepID=A0AA41RXT6_PAPNU|nr:hypothetical protein [Papaver nudicaule]
MSSRLDVINHYKRKFYQRYIDPDLVVEAMPLVSTQSSSSRPPVQPVRQRGSASTGGGNRTSATPTANRGLRRWDRQTLQFSMNAWVLVVALVATLPVIPENLSIKAHRLSFMGCLFTSIYTLYSAYGKPRAWTLHAGQVWFQSVIETVDFMTFVHCLIFIRTHVHYKFALIPVLCRSLEHVAKFLRRNFGRSTLYRKYLDEPCLWVESNTNILHILTSQAEIGLGFLLILSLLSWQRNITQTFVYWQLLKLMYHTPVTAAYHQNIWANIGRTLNPLINRYAPFMNSAISAAQRWWFR